MKGGNREATNTCVSDDTLLDLAVGHTHVEINSI